MGSPSSSFSLSEERFRAFLDERGILKTGALAAPGRDAAYLVFAQRDHARLDVAALKSHATRFFGTKLGLTVEKSYPSEPLDVDAARIVIAGDDGSASGTRLCYARPTEPADLSTAENAERAQNTSGMALLARRCPMVWLVVRESEDDRTALTLAAILASVLLGPILTPAGDELVGVRSARLKLEGRARPYR